MPYVKETLAPGEDYLYRAHFNWTYDVQSLFWLVLGAAPGLLWIVGAAMPGASAGGATYLTIAGLTFLLGALITLVRFVHKWTTVIAVTSVRLILKTGMIARKTHEVMLDEIEEVLMEQSFLGRLLGYGVLKARGTGDSTVLFPVIGQPTHVRREIEAAIMRARKMIPQTQP